MKARKKLDEIETGIITWSSSIFVIAFIGVGIYMALASSIQWKRIAFVALGAIVVALAPEIAGFFGSKSGN